MVFCRVDVALSPLLAGKQSGFRRRRAASGGKGADRDYKSFLSLLFILYIPNSVPFQCKRKKTEFVFFAHPFQPVFSPNKLVSALLEKSSFEQNA